MTPSEFANHAAEIAGLKATVQAQSREIRDLKQAAKDLAENHAAAVSSLAGKLDAALKQSPICAAWPRTSCSRSAIGSGR
jgi:cell division protein FtsL